MADFSVYERWKANYDDYYEGESEWRRSGAIGKSAHILAVAGAVPHDTILDIGAGEGAVLERLAELGFGRELHALEISDSAVDVIRERAIPSLVECQSFDGYTLPYADGSFDLAILSHVLEHVEYPRRLIYEAGRVARHVLVEVPLEHNATLPSDLTLDRIGHINFYTARSIRRLVQSCGFEVVAQRPMNPSRPIYQHMAGAWGSVKYLLKGMALRIAPRLACALVTYHGVLLYTAGAPDGD
jgi:SAM-dependent methyltransferase